MQSQDATTYLFRLWPWFEANAKRLIFGAVIILIAIFIFSFYVWRQNQKEITAGDAVTQAMLSGNGVELLKISAQHPRTYAGERAMLQGAAALFDAGKYADAQAQFEKFAGAYPDNVFLPQADLGIAASLYAQDKTDLAVAAYQKAAGQTSDLSVIAAAKFALAHIDQQQGKFSEAQKLYEDLAQTFPNSPMGTEARRFLVELKVSSPATLKSAPAAPATTMPFNLSH
ncbi:MAG TPA: tetratricopeptide repeat protein [Verrucomicrobiae bacterium]|nr:tetratricopeptide repeat protein [Verrucomicrobiae bacterium]